jgi:hypothetical protein
MEPRFGGMHLCWIAREHETIFDAKVAIGNSGVAAAASRSLSKHASLLFFCYYQGIKRSTAASAKPPAGMIEERNHETVSGQQGRPHGEGSREKAV